MSRAASDLSPAPRARAAPSSRAARPPLISSAVIALSSSLRARNSSAGVCAIEAADNAAATQSRTRPSRAARARGWRDLVFSLTADLARPRRPKPPRLPSGFAAPIFDYFVESLAPAFPGLQPLRLVVLNRGTGTIHLRRGRSLPRRGRGLAVRGGQRPA